MLSFIALVKQNEYSAIKIQITLVIIALITGCASKSEQQNLPCKGSNCQSTDLLDNTASKQEWYCYGKENGGDWHCGNQEDSTKIVSISPRNARQGQEKKPSSELLFTNPETRLEIEPIPRLTIGQNSISQIDTSRNSIKETSVKNNDYSLRTKAANTSSSLDGIPGNAYTLQIIALSDKEKLQQYIDQNEITDHFVAHTLSRGSSWYVLLVGIYTGYSEAKLAKLEWTNNHPRQSEPWIREIGSIQDTLVSQVEE